LSGGPRPGGKGGEKGGEGEHVEKMKRSPDVTGIAGKLAVLTSSIHLVSNHMQSKDEGEGRKRITKGRETEPEKQVIYTNSSPSLFPFASPIERPYFERGDKKRTCEERRGKGEERRGRRSKQETGCSLPVNLTGSSFFALHADYQRNCMEEKTVPKERKKGGRKRMKGCLRDTDISITSSSADLRHFAGERREERRGGKRGKGKG